MAILSPYYNHIKRHSDPGDRHHGHINRTQTFQNPLIKEYTLNYNGIPIMI